MASNTEVSVHFDPSTLAVGKTRCTGVLYFHTAEFDFPEAGWNDCVLVVLGWWCSAILGIVRGSSDHTKLQFMEGPFAFHIARSNTPERVLVSASRQGLTSSRESKDVVEWAGETDLKQLCVSITQAADACVMKVLALKQDGLCSVDLTELQKSSTALKHLLR